MAGMDELSGFVEAVARGLREGEFDPQHAGDLFLRTDAERAISEAVGAGSEILVAGKDGGRIRAASFLGARFAPDLVVAGPGGSSVAVTVTLLRGDAGSLATMLATALVLAGRYAAVVALVLDRRLGKKSPFGDGGEDAATQAPGSGRGITDSERVLLEQLWTQHKIRAEVRRQNPFGWD
jgi:hypothetical protein